MFCRLLSFIFFYTATEGSNIGLWSKKHKAVVEDAAEALRQIDPGAAERA
jgi:hypothetical protein